MNCRFTVVVLLLAVFIAGCGKNQPDGTWVGQSRVEGGKAGAFRETWTFHDGKIIVDDGDDAKWAYQVDATKEPKQIDIRPNVESVPNWNGRTGIYKIEKDTLTICSLIPSKAKDDAKRPEEFDATKRGDVVVFTFRKQK